MDRLEGHWLAELATVDARGAAGAEQGVQAGSTAAWLRHRLRMSAGTAASCVRTARALYRGPLTATGQALTEGAISPAHAQVLAHGTHDLPDHVAAEAEPVLLEAAGGWTRPGCGGPSPTCGWWPTPTAPTPRPSAATSGGGCGCRRPGRAWSPVNGLLDPEAGQTLLAALDPLARPHDADDTRSGGQRRADALTELARRHLEAGRLPQTGGVRPQLLVTVDLDSLLSHPGGLGGETGGPWPLDPEACRRLACDAAVTRVLVTRHRTNHHDTRAPTRDPGDEASRAGRSGQRRPGSPRPWAAPPPNRWRSAGPAGSSPPPNGLPWSSATAAVRSPAATGPRPGAKPTISGTGCTAAPPTSPTWPCCAGPIIARSTRAAGGSPATPTAG